MRRHGLRQARRRQDRPGRLQLAIGRLREALSPFVALHLRFRAGFSQIGRAWLGARAATTALLAVGCASSLEQVRTKSAPLLQCPVDAITVLSAGRKRYRSTGCGRFVDYECAASAFQCCAFVRPGVRQVGAASDDEKKPPSTSKEGRLKKAEIQRVIRAANNALTRCYQGGIQRPYRTGVVELQFVIQPDGRVGSVELVRSSLALDNVEQCAMDVVRTLEFGRPEGGGVVIVRHPFAFYWPDIPQALCD